MEILQKYAIDPYQQFAYTTGKNASDIALLIDAMDLLHSGRFDGFCLVRHKFIAKIGDEETPTYKASQPWPNEFNRRTVRGQTSASNRRDLRHQVAGTPRYLAQLYLFRRRC
jgi:hypothetical protein